MLFFRQTLKKNRRSEGYFKRRRIKMSMKLSKDFNVWKCLEKSWVQHSLHLDWGDCCIRCPPKQTDLDGEEDASHQAWKMDSRKQNPHQEIHVLSFPAGASGGSRQSCCRQFLVLDGILEMHRRPRLKDSLCHVLTMPPLALALLSKSKLLNATC